MWNEAPLRSAVLKLLIPQIESILPVKGVIKRSCEKEIVIAALQKRMIEDIQLAGLNPRTQESYVRAVRKLAELCKKSPDKITENEIQASFLYVNNVSPSLEFLSSVVSTVIAW